MRRSSWWLAVLLCLVVAAQAADYAPDGGVDRSLFARFGDLGTKDDFNPLRDVYFPAPPDNYWLYGTEHPEQFIRYERPDKFYWVTAPKKAATYTNARVIKSNYAAQLYIRALPTRAAAAFLAVRFKDNLRQPTTVDLATKSGWEKIGELGGAFDHQWKVATFTFDSARALADSGAYALRIGRGDYGDLRGDLPVDWVGLAPKAVAVPGPVMGFWPALAASRFSDIGHTMEYIPGQGPKLLAGVLVKGMREKSWKQFAAAHVNAIIFQGWETIWKRHWEVYAAERYHDRVRYGFPDWNEACHENGLLCTSQFFTDTRSYWIERVYRNEDAALAAIYEVMKFNANADGNLCWYLKDEADHNDETWGIPPEYLIELYNLEKQADPARAAAVLFQGWKADVFANYAGAFDIAGFDVYPLGADRDVTEISDRIEAMRAGVGESKALWAVIEGHEGEHERNRGRQLTAAETLVQGYLSLAHDVDGVFYYIGNEAAYIDPFEEMPGPWAGMAQFFAEVNGEGGLARWFVPPAETVARTTVENDEGPDETDVHFIHKRLPDGSHLVVAVNTSDQPLTEVTINASGLEGVRQVEVMFEKRTVALDGGAWSDDFPAYGRHVYTW